MEEKIAGSGDAGGVDEPQRDTRDLQLPTVKSRSVVAILMPVTLWLSLTAFVTYAGYFAMYFFFDYMRDDEGYWLTSLRYYDLHGSLYHNTFTQVGPFYYEMWSFIFSVLRFGIYWDTGRLMTLIMWIGMSLLCGIAIWILTKRLLLGLLAEVVCFLVMFPLVAVPMEPAGLGHFLGAVVLLGLALFVRGSRRVGMAMVGVASAVLLLTKVNIGVFVLAGIVAAAAFSWPSRRWLIGRRVAVTVGILAIPILLMGQLLSRQWVWEFCLLELLYLASLIGILLTRTVTRQAFVLREIGIGIVAALGSALLIGLGVLFKGTSLSTLVYGALLRQRGFGTKGPVAPLPISRPDFVVAAVALAVVVVIAAFTVKLGRRPNWLASAPSAYIRIGVGVWILLTMTGNPGAVPHGLVLTPSVTIPVPGGAFLLAAPFAWVAALGHGGDDDAAFSFARTAVCLIGVIGCLEAFPIAGAQLWWAEFAMVPLGILCIADGLSILSPLRSRSHSAARGVLEVPIASIAVAVFAAFQVFGNTGAALAAYKSAYYANAPVRLAGAARVRLPLVEVQDLHAVTSFLRRECSTYWSLPGLDSFYLFSGEKPPSGLNLSQGWWYAFTASQEDQVLHELRGTPRLCLVEDSFFSNGTYLGRHVDQTPLIRYLEHDFVPAKVGGGFYQLLVRRS